MIFLFQHELLISPSKAVAISQKILPTISTLNKKEACLVIDSQKGESPTIKLDNIQSKTFINDTLNNKGIFPYTVAKLSGGASVHLELDEKNLSTSIPNLVSLFQYFAVSVFCRNILIIINEFQNLPKISPLIDLLKAEYPNNIKVLAIMNVSNIDIAHQTLRQAGYSEKEIRLLFDKCKISRLPS